MLEPDLWRHAILAAYVTWGDDRLHAARCALALCPGLAFAHWLPATVFIAREGFEPALEELRPAARRTTHRRRGQNSPPSALICCTTWCLPHMDGWLKPPRNCGARYERVLVSARRARVDDRSSRSVDNCGTAEPQLPLAPRMPSSPQILILGSGAGALFLALELGKGGCKVTVAGEQPLAQFASTRNQGWLQSGAFYAGLGQFDVARECMLSSVALGQLAPSAVGQHRRCFYLFEYQADAETFFENVAAAGVGVRAIVNPHAAKATSAFVHGSLYYDFAVEAFDRPFNTRHVLEIVRDQAVALGCQFENVTVGPGCVSKKGGTWLLTGGNGSYDRVVIAAGAQTAAVASSLGVSIPFDSMWITVLSVTGVQLDSMLLSPNTLKPNLVPFAPGLGDGFTAVLARKDQWGIPDDALVPAEGKLIEDGIQTHLPALGSLMSGPGVAIGAHTCTKLAPKGNPTARGALIQSLDATQTLWVFYPGKFTTSILAARDCARAVQGYPAGSVDVSRQPYP